MGIKELLEGKDAQQKATTKGIEIAKVVKRKKYALGPVTKTWK